MLVFEISKKEKAFSWKTAIISFGFWALKIDMIFGRNFYLEIDMYVFNVTILEYDVENPWFWHVILE